MDQVRKFGMWMWSVKEKLVLACLAVILCVQVYKVVTSSQGAVAASEVPTVPPKPPKKELSENVGVEAPDAPPEPIREQEFGPLVRRNPFTVYGIEASTTEEETSDTASLNLTLEGIREWNDGTYRAEIRTQGSSAERYAEGESAEDFRVERIDPEAQQVTVFSFKHNNTFTLSVGGSS